MANSTLSALTLAAQAAATVNGSDLENIGARGAHITIDITARTSTATATFTVQGKDEVSGQYYTILATTALAAVATTVLRIYPGVAAAANLAVSDVLPKAFRVICTVASAGAITATVGVALVD